MGALLAILLQTLMLYFSLRRWDYAVFANERLGKRYVNDVQSSICCALCGVVWCVLCRSCRGCIGYNGVVSVLWVLSMSVLCVWCSELCVSSVV